MKCIDSLTVSTLDRYFTVRGRFRYCTTLTRDFSKELGGDMIDCSNLGSSAHPISADINLQQQFYSDAKYILVIEKVWLFDNNKISS